MPAFFLLSFLRQKFFIAYRQGGNFLSRSLQSIAALAGSRVLVHLKPGKVHRKTPFLLWKRQKYFWHSCCNIVFSQEFERFKVSRWGL
jgi:hypothetical protein